MKNINKEVKAFLETHRVSVLANSLANGHIHAAAEYYSFTTKPFHFFFSTFLTTRKSSGMINGDSVQAGLVIGFQEKEWITFQAE